MTLRRGDLVTIAVSGDYGKPRPALVIQSDAFSEIASVTVLPLTSELHDWPLFRVRVHPSGRNGLQKISDVMVGRAVTVSQDRIGLRIGRIEDDVLSEIDRALTFFLGLKESAGRTR